MGFWRRLFGLETEQEREARRLRKLINKQNQEIRLRNDYIDLVIDAIENSDEFGYTVECLSIFEPVVLSAIKLYTRFHYIVLWDTTDELEWKGKIRITVRYITIKSAGQKEIPVGDPT